jgi:hypothetical protein
VIGCDHGVEFFVESTPEYGVGWKRSGNPHSCCGQSGEGRLVDTILFVPEQAVVRGVRVERTQAHVWVGYSPPGLETITEEQGLLNQQVRGQQTGYVTKRVVGSGEKDPEGWADHGPFRGHEHSDRRDTG